MALSENEQVHTKPARDRGSMREWLSLILVIGGLFFFAEPRARASKARQEQHAWHDPVVSPVLFRLHGPRK